MWASVKTEAIVLTTQPWKEADRRYTAISPELGYLEFIGRGARKGKAKLAAHIEPLSVVQLELVRGARQMTVINAERQEVFRRIQVSLEGRMAALSAASLLHASLRPEVPDTELYLDFLTFARTVNEAPHLTGARAAFFAGGFALRTLTALGYAVSLKRCVGCSVHIVPLSFRWHDIKGGVVCTDCILRAPHDWIEARSTPEEVLALLRFARMSTYDDLLRPQLRVADVYAFTQCVQGLVRLHVPGAVGWGDELADLFLLPGS